MKRFIITMAPSLVAALCLSGCYETHGPLIATDARSTPLRAGPYCIGPWMDLAESTCFDLALADQQSYVLTPEAGGDNIIDTTPFRVYVRAQPVKTGAYAGYYVAEACRTGEDYCTLGLIKIHADDNDFDYYAPACGKRECRFGKLEKAVTTFERLPPAPNNRLSGAVIWQGTPRN